MALLLAEELPFGSALLPSNTQLSFLEAPLPQVVQEFMGQQQALGRECMTHAALHESTAASLARLRPLSFLGRQHLFVPTGNNWTAYFNDYPLGTNLHATVPELAVALRCRALWIEAQPWLGTSKPEEALGFSVFDPECLGWRRSVGLRQRNGFWRFWQLGVPFLFEDKTRYQLRKRKRRLDLACLRQYARALGVRPFDDAFYLEGAVLVSCGPFAQ